jgi:hypothetical protein
MDLSKMRIYTHQRGSDGGSAGEALKSVDHSGLSSIWVSLPLYLSYACLTILGNTLKLLIKLDDNK